ncbi:unnamed protein product [Heterobilharzia americana]|nr:unnamed protein product [Heterobilharzia americana]CAH8436594.1 unnamed protein product [Heterobilharzia americana]
MNALMIGVALILSSFLSHVYSEQKHRSLEVHLNGSPKYLKLNPKTIAKESSAHSIRKFFQLNSTSDIFSFSRPLIPVWMTNPIYFLFEKLLQLFAYIANSDEYLELNRLGEVYYF